MKKASIENAGTVVAQESVRQDLIKKPKRPRNISPMAQKLTQPQIVLQDGVRNSMR